MTRGKTPRDAKRNLCFVRRIIPLLLFALAVPLLADDPIFQSAAGHDCFVRLLKDSGWGMVGPYERAAFIIENPDGTIVCQEWPSIHSFNSEHFYGAPPPNTVAIAHTHPVQFPRPSEHDEDEATRIAIPIYTITIRGVYKSIPGSLDAIMVADKQSWVRATPALTAHVGTNGVSGELHGDRLSNK